MKAPEGAQATLRAMDAEKSPVPAPTDGTADLFGIQVVQVSTWTPSPAVPATSCRHRLLLHSHINMANANTTSAHTPGPWTFDRIDPRFRDQNEMFRIDGNSEFPSIADVFARDWDAEAEANARLIAAAPELLGLVKSFRATCEERLSLLQDEKDWRPDDEWHDMIGHFETLLNRCNQALARAQGQG